MEDEPQVYLLGLRYYATGQWPYFGPDIGGIRAQLPGALQALLVGLPLRVVPVPEAPFVLLNVLLDRRDRRVRVVRPAAAALVPGWLVYGLLLTAPWTLQFSTHVVNVSYLLPRHPLLHRPARGLPALRIGVVGVPPPTS
jgi:hypothetical protein